MAIAGRIEARNLSFTYPGAPDASLHGLSFAVEPGQTLAIVGPTGSGKSTLVNLLPRLAEPARGTLFVDGADVCDMPVAHLRGAIGMVMQEPFLFSDTVGGNILFGTGEEWSDPALRRGRRARPNLPASRATSNRSRPDTRRWSASAASRYPVGRSNASRLLARS